MSRGHQHTVSAPSINTPREAIRHGWYHGPMATTSSGAEGPGDRYSRVERMIHPNLANGFTGFTSTVPQTVHEHPPPVERDPNSDPLRRLEALVAVATSEGSTATALLSKRLAGAWLSAHPRRGVHHPPQWTDRPRGGSVLHMG